EVCNLITGTEHSSGSEKRFVNTTDGSSRKRSAENLTDDSALVMEPSEKLETPFARYRRLIDVVLKKRHGLLDHIENQSLEGVGAMEPVPEVEIRREPDSKNKTTVMQGTDLQNLRSDDRTDRYFELSCGVIGKAGNSIRSLPPAHRPVLKKRLTNQLENQPLEVMRPVKPGVEPAPEVEFVRTNMKLSKKETSIINSANVATRPSTRAAAARAAHKIAETLK
ncbi:unnamed protein product, partial [Caenorhabditis auriculariae]